MFSTEAPLPAVFLIWAWLNPCIQSLWIQRTGCTTWLVMTGGVRRKTRYPPVLVSSSVKCVLTPCWVTVEITRCHSFMYLYFPFWSHVTCILGSPQHQQSVFLFLGAMELMRVWFQLCSFCCWLEGTFWVNRLWRRGKKAGREEVILSFFLNARALSESLGSQRQRKHYWNKQPFLLCPQA
jgi:hypothetical protein